MDYNLEQYENWCSEFCHEDAFFRLGSLTREYAPQVLPFFLNASLNSNGQTLTFLDFEHVSQGFNKIKSELSLPKQVLEECPKMCSLFVKYLQTTGRISSSENLIELIEEVKLKVENKPIQRPGSKLNRNDPCPCGSKLKYKKCCMNLLG
jgi:hypothetical protein